MQTIAQQITNIIEESLTDMGFELVLVKFKGVSPKVVEVLIDSLNGNKISIEDCTNVSRTISAILDVEDLIEKAYSLEVSSSGIERTLVKFENYNRFLGREVKIKLKELLNGKTLYQGKIIKAENNKIYLKCAEQEVSIDFNLIRNANLVLTEEVFKKLLGS
ncbi:ribosome maturation factor RimP [Rickettsia prowazekii]|uniref:ribosome maturation factor RimP n=1 Tax=Rickettsia prowazekii TaxID=782 RepID=UPI000256C8BC|nr:ribosome maturation factor RimP [Rickettsia prowazekii]AFE51047.1 ribosome maturation protein RimP [Rickettsia prowazekii str. BuV67-CWPP]